eukprot:1141163-Pelagomonas_calceolata.AAC.4
MSNEWLDKATGDDGPIDAPEAVQGAIPTPEQQEEIEALQLAMLFLRSCVDTRLRACSCTCNSSAPAVGLACLCRPFLRAASV